MRPGRAIFRRSAGFQLLLFFVLLGVIDVSLLALVLIRGSNPFWLVSSVYYSNFLVVPLRVCAAVMLSELRRGPRLSRLLLVPSLALVCVFIYATFVEPHRLQVDRVTILTSKLDRELKLVHISDLQSRKIESYEQRVFETINQLDPDIVVHTGDLVQPWKMSLYREELERAAQLFGTLKPRIGVYHVEGDVDLDTDLVKFDQLAGTHSLNNTSTNLGPIQILGLRLMESRQSNPPPIGSFLKESDSSQFRIVIGHTPNFIPNAAPGIDLCLAGHTHGGQVQLPWVGALVTMSDIPRSWAYGFRQHNGVWLNISAGIGAEHTAYLPSIRFLCPPRITLITLKPSGAGGGK